MTKRNIADVLLNEGFTPEEVLDLLVRALVRRIGIEATAEALQRGYRRRVSAKSPADVCNASTPKGRRPRRTP